MTTVTVRDDADDYARETDVLMAFVRDGDSTDWMRLGACAVDGDPKLFFPVVRQVVVDGDLEDVEPEYPSDEVKAVCGFCPVKDICLSYALAHRTVGVWGGTTTYQREQLHRRRARKSCPGCSGTTVIESTVQHVHVQLCLSCGVSWPS